MGPSGGGPCAPAVLTFRTTPVGSGVMMLICLGVTGVGIRLLVNDAPHLPWLAWVLAAPILLIGGLIITLVDLAIIGAFRSTSLPSNWAMKVTEYGVFLQLRSHMNHAMEGNENTAVFLPYDELHAVRKVIERNDNSGMGGDDTSIARYLELHTEDVDTEPLRRAVSEEMRRKGDMRRLLGMTMQSRSGHVPVRVPGPGVIRVDWHGKRMLEVMRRRGIEVLPEWRVTIGESSDDPAEIDAHILELIEEGKRIDAIALTRTRLSLSLTDAREYVEALQQSAA